MPRQKNASFLLHIFIATGFFSGYSPAAPGTAGSAVCIIILWLLPHFQLHWMIVLGAALLSIGAISANVVEKIWGRDPGKINIDEIAGMVIALAGLPKTIWLWLTAFIIFRLLDIFKPFPIRSMERLPGGIGIMADDIMAGIYTNLICWFLVWII